MKTGLGQWYLYLRLQRCCLCGSFFPAGSGQTAGVYQDGRLIRTIYLRHAGQTETFEVPGPAGGQYDRGFRRGHKGKRCGLSGRGLCGARAFEGGRRTDYLPAEPAGDCVYRRYARRWRGRGCRREELRDEKAAKLTLAALLTAAGLVVFVIEAQLPP